MPPENTSRFVNRLTDKLTELETQLARDTDSAIDQYQAHRLGFQAAIRAFTEDPEDLKNKFADEALDLQKKLNELEIQLKFPNMETEDAYREQRSRIMHALTALESTIQKIETAEDDKGSVHYRDFAKRARRFEDKLEALHVHFALEKMHSGKALENTKEELSNKAAELKKRLKSLEVVTGSDLERIENDIRESSEVIRDYLDAFMNTSRPGSNGASAKKWIRDEY